MRSFHIAPPKYLSEMLTIEVAYSRASEIFGGADLGYWVERDADSTIAF